LSDVFKDDHERRADAVVSKYMKWAAGLSLIPIPGLDFAGIIGSQVAMLNDLAKVYSVDFSSGVARSLIASLIGGLGAEALAAGTAPLLVKYIPGPLFLLGAAAASASAAAVTYAVGKIFTMHFAAGGTLLTFDAARMRAHFHTLYKEKLGKDAQGKPKS
jgi:uncharacterized protein (DUF697 family)